MPSLETLLDGFKVFKKHFLENISTEKIKALIEGQSPRTLMISCSDSRVDPAILLDFQLGEVFSIRNIANIVPPFQPDHSTYHGTSSALEYAVEILEVETIIVLGHSDCGGIKALMEHEESEKSHFDYLLEWVFILEDAKKEVLLGKEKQPLAGSAFHECEKKGIEISLRNLETFPFIKKRIDKGTLKILGLYFSLHDLHLEYYDEKTKSFQIVE